jgi:hypothetical protein
MTSRLHFRCDELVGGHGGLGIGDAIRLDLRRVRYRDLCGDRGDAGGADGGKMASQMITDAEDGYSRTLSASAENPEPPDGYQPGCPNRQCLCWRPGRVCDEFMGLEDWRYCPRCGWARELHTNTERIAPVMVTANARPEYL